MRRLPRRARTAVRALRRIPWAIGALESLVAQSDELVRRSESTLALAREIADERQRNAYVADGTAWVRTRWGRKILVDTRDLLVAPWLLLDGLWETEVTRFFQETIVPGQVVVDVGANVGYFTMLAAHLTTHVGHVYSFEAQPDTYKLLVKGILANWMDPYVTAEHLAVYEKSGSLELFVRTRFSGNSSLAPSEPESEVDDSVEAVRVDAVSLDEYFADHPTHVDFIKVDVEGFELQVFRGMRQLLSDNPAVTIMCEWSPDQAAKAGNDPAALVEEFRRHDFSVKLITGGLEDVDIDRLADMPYGNIVLRRR